MKPNFSGAVLLGGVPEAEAMKRFRLSFAQPWEVLRYRVQYRVEDGKLHIIVTDPWTGIQSSIGAPTETIVTAASSPQQMRVCLQEASDKIRQAIGIANGAGMRAGKAWLRYKAWRRKNARKD